MSGIARELQSAPTEEPTEEFFEDDLTTTLPPKNEVGQTSQELPGDSGDLPEDDLPQEGDSGGEEPTFEPTYLTDPPTPLQEPKDPTYEPTYLTDEPTSKPAEPTYEPTYLTSDPTDSPSTGFPTFAPTMTHSPTVVETTIPPVPSLTDPPTAGDSEEDSMSDSAIREVTENPTAMPPVAGPTMKPTIAPTMKPTNPTAVIKEEKYRNKFVGFQSDWGPAFPGSMTYDFTRNSIYVTGTTFAPNKLEETSNDFQRSTCFVGELPIADIEEWVVDDPPQPLGANTKDFVVPDSFDDREAMGCHIVYYNHENEIDDTLYVGTVTEPDATKRKGKINAGLNTYSRNRYSPNWQHNSVPTDLDHSDGKVRWPVAMTESLAGEIMILTVGSDDQLLTEAYIENGDANNAKNSKNSLAPPGLYGADPSKYAVPKRGSNFYMTYETYKKTENGPVLSEGEELKSFDEDGDVFPTGIAVSHSHHLFVGYFRGGAPRRFMIPLDFKNPDFDGFVTGLHFPSGRPTFEKGLSHRFASIETLPRLDDYVHDICMPPPSPDGTNSFFYVVGSTYGTMGAGYSQSDINTNILKDSNGIANGNEETRLSAWVSKVDMNRKSGRAVVWTTQLFATNDNISLKGGMTEAFGCHVLDADKTKLYIAGTVYNGGTMDSAQKSAGGDDVWVAQLNSKDGNIRWITQIGSSGDEKLARTKGIESDLNGHAIIFGETTGELYRKRKGEKKNMDDGSSTDIFVTTLDVDTGISESTIESDRVYDAEMKAIIGGSVAAVMVLLCCCCGFLLKWRRAQKYAAKDTDGVLKTANISPGEEEAFADAPPTKAFQDSLSDDGNDDEVNGDAGGGLSKFV